MAKKSHEIIIAGAGPAGISTALFLEKIMPGISDEVLILEKEIFPREKPCAGAITYPGLNILDELELPVGDSFKSVSSVLFTYGNLKIKFPQKNPSIVVNRSLFDSWLAGEAVNRGFKINFGEKFCITEKKNGRLFVKSDKDEYACSVLVGADGAKSSVRRSFFKNGNNLSPLLISKCRTEKNSHDDINSLIIDFTCLHYGTAGYIWNFPSNEDGKRHTGIFIWMGKQGKEMAAMSILKDYHQRMGLLPDEEIYSGYVEKLYDPASSLSAENIILTGEAAGIDALMGEGISESLQYGRFTAEEIIRAIRKKDFSFKDYSARFKKSSLSKELSECFKYSKYFYDGNFRFWLSLLYNSERFRKFLFNDFSGYGNLSRHTLSLASIVAEHKLRGKKDLSESGL